MKKTPKGEAKSGADSRLNASNRLLRSTDLADQIGLNLRAALGAVWSDLTLALEPVGLRPQHYAALSIVEGNPGCKQQEVGVALGIHSSNLVALIDDLVQAELIARSRHGDDKRSYALSLTPQCHDAMPRIRAAHREHQKRLETALSGCDAVMFLTALRKLASIRTN